MHVLCGVIVIDTVAISIDSSSLSTRDKRSPQWPSISGVFLFLKLALHASSFALHAYSAYTLKQQLDPMYGVARRNTYH